MLKSDVLIVGAGPVGLFAIFACGQLDLGCIVVDTLEQPGGQCISLYPDKPIYDIPGRRAIGASELVDELVAQRAPYKPQYLLAIVSSRCQEAQRKVGVFGPTRDS